MSVWETLEPLGHDSIGFENSLESQVQLTLINGILDYRFCNYKAKQKRHPIARP